MYWRSVEAAEWEEREGERWRWAQVSLGEERVGELTCSSRVVVEDCWKC
jgi:hypothetical protein